MRLMSPDATARNRTRRSALALPDRVSTLTLYVGFFRMGRRLGPT